MYASFVDGTCISGLFSAFSQAVMDSPIIAGATLLCVAIPTALWCKRKKPGALKHWSHEHGPLGYRTPDFRFPAPLNQICALAKKATQQFAEPEKTIFSRWLTDASASMNGRTLIAATADFNNRRRLELMVPLIVLRLLWRQRQAELGTNNPLPAALSELLMHLCKATGHPPRLTQFMHSRLNWQSDLLLPGSTLDHTKLIEFDRIHPAFPLTPHATEAHFLRGFFCAEVILGHAVQHMMSAMQAVQRHDTKGLIRALEHITAHLTVFRRTVTAHMHKVEPTEFLPLQTIVASKGDMSTAGASGFQVVPIILLDLLLLPKQKEWPLQAHLDNRKCLPEPEQALLANLSGQPSLADYVHSQQNSALTAAYQACIQPLIAFRTAHKGRVMTTLKQAGSTSSTETLSAGNTNELVTSFQELMNLIIIQTKKAQESVVAYAA